MLLRNGRRLIPEGKTVLLENDIVILCAYKYGGEHDISLHEHKILSDSEWIGRTIQDFSPHSGELVIMIIRNHKTVLPKGKTQIKENDILVIHSSLHQPG